MAEKRVSGGTWTLMYMVAGGIDFMQALLTLTGLGIVITWVIAPIASFGFWLWFKQQGIPLGSAKQLVVFAVDFVPVLNWFNNLVLVGMAQQMEAHPTLASAANVGMMKGGGKGAKDTNLKTKGEQKQSAPEKPRETWGEEEEKEKRAGENAKTNARPLMETWGDTTRNDYGSIPIVPRGGAQSEKRRDIMRV